MNILMISVKKKKKTFKFEREDFCSSFIANGSFTGYKLCFFKGYIVTNQQLSFLKKFFG